MNKIFRKHSAFSLIELLIVIAIMAIMSVVAYASLTSGRSQARAKEAQREVAATIRLAQGYALQGKTQNGITPCGYGVVFDNNKTTYHIFYNLLDTAGFANCDDQNNDSSQERKNKNPGSTNAEDYALQNGVTLSSPNVSQATVYFTVPHASMFDWQGDSYSSQVLSLSFSGVTKTITINMRGYLTESP